MADLSKRHQRTDTRERSSALLTANSDAHEIDVVELSENEEYEYIQYLCCRELGMDLEEFRRRWNAGEFAGNDDPKVTAVAMLLPDAR